MTYLFVCGGSYVSGMEIVELAIMRGLAERGARVHCIVSGWNDGVFIERLERAGIPHTVAFVGKLTFGLKRLDWTADTFRHVRGARYTVRAVANELKPDIVIVCNRDALLLLCGVFGKAPVVFHVHEAPDLSGRSRLLYRLVRRSVDAFFTVSAFVRDRTVALGVSNSRVYVVRNGVEPRSCASHVPCKKSCPVVGICGQIGEWKGHSDLVEAMGILARRGVQGELRVYGVGDDEYVGSLRHQANALGIGDRIRWMGFEPDPDRMYAGLDVVVVPSRSGDPFPTTVLEASARGLPVVGTRRGGIPEMIVDGETGYLVEGEDPSALADALEDLLSSPSRRRVFGTAAKERVEQEYLTSHMVSRFERAVGALLSGSVARRTVQVM